MNGVEAAVQAQLAEFERRAELHTVSFGTGHVSWRKIGKGDPLVLLHGGHGGWLHWVRNLEFLARHHTLWIPDLPGYGSSSDPPDGTLESLVDTTCRTLDSLIGPDTPFGLAGFSFGGLVAAHIAARRPHIKRLALLGSAGHGGQRRPRGELKTWRGAYERQDRAELQQVMRNNLLVHMLYDDRAADDLALAIHSAACYRTRFFSKSFSRSGGLGECLAKYDGPVLLIWGEHDVTADPQEAAAVLAGGRGDRQVHILPDAGHWVQYESADAVNRLLTAWFDEVDHHTTPDDAHVRD